MNPRDATLYDYEDDGDTVIANTVIKKPRVKRKCEQCGTLIEGPQRRIFGKAFSSDPVFVIYLHFRTTDCRFE